MRKKRHGNEVKMKFKLECDDSDGLVLIDKGCLKELNSDMLYAMDILLDVQGRSELIYDFPDENWSAVRLRETKELREFCSSGKMIIWLLDGIEKECEIETVSEIAAPSKWLYAPTGKLLAVTASELTACLSYPELEMEKVFELEVDEGWYAIAAENIDKIAYCKKEPQNLCFENIQEIILSSKEKKQ